MDGGEVAGGASPSSAESSFRELDDVFLQTQTRIWLGEVLQTRLDEHLNISDLLADGELLFEVSKVVWKMLLTNRMEIKHLKAYKAVSSRKSSGRYRPYSNVDSFLKISKILGLTGIDLFSPSDVVEKRNTRRVCMCIRSLSKKARSKNLDVPDFDIVTYTVAMPTNMVGCIRRSLELSQCSFSSSDSYNQYKDPKMTCRKKNSVAAGARNYDTYSQESDIESNYTGFQSHSPSMNCASDSASLINLDLENSPEVSSVVKSYTSVQNEFQLEIQDQEKDEYTLCQCESRCLDEPVGSLCSHCVKKDHLADSISFPSWVDSEIKLRTRSSSHINRGVRHDHQIDMLDLIHIDLYLGNGASTVGDSTDGSSLEKGHASHDLAIPDLIDHGTDDGGHVLFDGDDDILKLEMSSDSCGSNSPGQTSVNGFGRIHSDNLEDAEEVSSMASLGSVTGRVRHLDFEDQLDEEDDWRTVKVLFPELQSQKDDLVNRSCLIGVHKSQDMLRHEKIIHSSTLGYPDQIRDLSDNGKMTIGGTMTESDPGIKEHSNELLQAAYFDRVCEDSNASSDIIASQDGEKWNKLSHTDCSVGFKHCECPHILDMIEVDNHVQPYESTLEKYLCLTSGSSQNVGKTGQEVCTDPENCIPCAENMGKASGQDERKHEKMDVSAAEISDRKEDISTGIPHHKPQKRPRLKSLVIGTAVFGAVLVLLHLRRRSSRDETGEPSIRPRQTQKMEGSLADELYSETLQLSRVKLDQGSTTNLKQDELCDSNGDDLWHEDASLGDGSDEDLDKVSDLDREWQRRRDQFHTIGYRDGVIAGKEASAQEGFNIGFKESVFVGYKWGLVRGVTSALACLPDGLKEKLVETQEARNKFQCLYKTVHSLSTDNALKLFHDGILKNKSVEQTGNVESSSNVADMQDRSSDSNVLENHFEELQSLTRESPTVKVHLTIDQ